MPTVKSPEDLKKIHAETLKKRKAQASSGVVQVLVALGSSGLATGSCDTLREIASLVDEKGLTKVSVKQTGGLGLDSWEPVVQVIKGDAAAVTYGRVTPKAARRIVEEHILKDEIVSEYLVTK